MDISFKTEEGRFNYRVCAIIIHDGKILAMKNERTPYYFLPGGRVGLHETAEVAILRELKEELEIDTDIVRPLWLNQSFFTEDVSKEKFHEICLYFLVDVSKTDLLLRGDTFTMRERHHTLQYEWLRLERLKEEYFYPTFLKEKFLSCRKDLLYIRNYNEKGRFIYDGEVLSRGR